MRVSLCGVVITIDHIHVHSQRNTRTEREMCEGQKQEIARIHNNK